MSTSSSWRTSILPRSPTSPSRALAGLAPRPLPPRAFAKQPAIVIGRTDIVEQDAGIRRPGLYFKKLIRMEEGDVYAMGAARTLVTSFLASRLPGSLFDVIVDKGKLATGNPSISLSRVASKTFTLTIGADAAPDVAPETLLAAVTGYVEQLAPCGLSAEMLARLKTRFAEGQAAADRDPRLTYNRLVGWLAGRNRYEQLALLPQRVAAVSPEQVASGAHGALGAGTDRDRDARPRRGSPPMNPACRFVVFALALALSPRRHRATRRP